MCYPLLVPICVSAALLVFVVLRVAWCRVSVCCDLCVLCLCVCACVVSVLFGSASMTAPLKLDRVCLVLLAMRLQLGLALYDLFAAGHLPATAVNELARAAWADGWGFADAGFACRLRDAQAVEDAVATVQVAWEAGCSGSSADAERIASAGSWGKYTSNIQRDIFASAERSGIVDQLPHQYCFEARGPGGTTVQHSMFLPHETLHMQLPREDSLKEFVLADEDLAQPIGRLVVDWCAHRDVNHADPRTVIPIGMHGDGVSYTTQQRAGGVRSVIVICMNTLGGSPAQRKRRLMVSMLAKDSLCDCGCSGFHTLQDFFGVWSWSLQHLRGYGAPSCRHDKTPFSSWDLTHRLKPGTPLPTAALVQIRGDWEWMSVAYRFRTPSEEFFCWLCLVRRSNYRNELCPDAPHRAGLRSHADFLTAAMMSGSETSRILESPGVELKHFAIDQMHTGELGPVLDAVGSILWVEITCKSWHRSQSRGLRRVNEELADYYTANPTLSPLRLVISQIRSAANPYPVLKAKAAQAKHLCQYCLTLAHRHAGHGVRAAYSFRPGTRLAKRNAEYHRLIVALFEGITSYYRACDDEVFDEGVAKASMYAFLQSLEQLNRLWCSGLSNDEERKRMPFHIRPKCHMLQHLVEDQLRLWGTPKNFSCYTFPV